jgi:tRNA pseudouridine65 synthase
MGEVILKREFSKKYLALVRGYPPDVFRLNYQVPQGRREEKKPAMTGFTTLDRTELDEKVGIYDTARYSLLNVIPESGRRHQIRRHLKHIYYPIIGDRRYGDRAHNKYFKEKLELPQMFLHAKELVFTNPLNGEKLLLQAPLPDHWSKALKIFE